MSTLAPERPAASPADAAGQAARPQPVPYVPVFDGFRAAAVLCIVLAHIVAATAWNPQTEFLDALRRTTFFTAEFLFVISGFTLFLPVVAQGGLQGVREYAARRAARIVPAYWVSLVVTLAAAIILGRVGLPPDGGKQVLVHLFFLQHELGFRGLAGVNKTYWILSILFLFYALVPLVASRYLRHPWVGLALAIGAMLAWRLPLQAGATEAGPGYALFIQFPLFVADFAIGMTAAWVFVRLRQEGWAARLRTPSVAIVLLALCSLTALLWVIGAMRSRGEAFFFGEPAPLAVVVPVVYAALVVASAFLPRAFQWPLANRGVRWVAEVSYGTFLYHMVILVLVWYGLGFTRDHSLGTTVLLAVIVIPTSLLAGWLSYRYVERPIRERARRLSQRRAEGRLPTDGPPVASTAPASGSIATVRR